MPEPVCFCLCADDYAITAGVSRGIREALDAGALTATSVMTTSACWPDEAVALRRFAEVADIGLHLNLTLGRPLAAMPMLAPGGTLPSVGALIRRSCLGSLPQVEIAAEIDRQCERFNAVFGRPPDHVDGHQHVHVLPGVRTPLLATLARRGWHPWIRNSGDSPGRIVARREAVPKALMVAALAGNTARRAEAKGFIGNDGFAGFSSFDPSRAYRDAFGRFIAFAGRRHLVMCHPGYVDEELRAIDPVTDTREDELAFLLSGDYPALLRRRRATPVRGSDAWR